MDINLFSKIVKKLDDDSLEDFKYKHGNVIYGFKDIGDDNWEDDGSGKYQYKSEEGQLIEMDEHYKEIQSFNFGVSRSIQRCGSYFTGYNYETEDYNMFEIKEVLIPEKIIPAHVKNEWIKLDIDIDDITDEEEEEEKRIEAEKIRLEEEERLEIERLTKLYPMNNSDIIQMVRKSLKKKKIEKFTIDTMRKEYLEIVIQNNLESQEWIDYHKGLRSKITE